MKKITAVVLAVVMLCALASNALAASADFPDITDAGLARDVASLQMLGVIDGYDDGRFDPQGTLTRAAFCKMAVVIMGRCFFDGSCASTTISSSSTSLASH